jgi:hypothetical protein
MTDLPLIALIRYHVLPEPVRPAHVSRQEPPLTVATTVTFVPAVMVVRIAPLVLALLRRLTPLQAAALVVVAPKTSVGEAIEMTADERIARSIPMGMR